MNSIVFSLKNPCRMVTTEKNKDDGQIAHARYVLNAVIIFDIY